MAESRWEVKRVRRASALTPKAGEMRQKFEVAVLVAAETAEPGALVALEDLIQAARQALAEQRGKGSNCPEGGEHEMSPDYEYDESGRTINCSKCGFDGEVA